MKNIIILNLLIVTLFSTLSSFSQLPIAFKIGINNSKINESYNKNYTSLYLGFSSEYVLNKKVNILSELIYSIEGSKSSLDAWTNDQKTFLGTVDVINKLSKLNLPLLLQIKLYNDIKIASGIQIAYILKNTEYFPSISSASSQTTDNINLTNRLNFSIPIDIRYSNSKLPFYFNLRYNYGLNNIYKNGGKLNVLQFGLNYVIPKKFFKISK